MDVVKIYYRNPTIGLSTVENLCSKVNNKLISYFKQVKEFLQNHYSAQIHKNIYQNIYFPIYVVYTYHENDILQVDFMHVLQ